MESAEGTGSRFWFSLTFPRAAGGAAAELAPAPVDLRCARVLVAEDDPTSQVVARDLLGRRGALVTVAATGAEAVAAAAAGGFDIVLMDIRMPEMDGLEACRRIRALPNGEALPIIALTANALAEERQRCLAAGMDGYLTKPLEPEALYAELCRGLRLPAEETRGRRPASVAVAAETALPGFDAAKVRRWLTESPDAWRTMVRIFVAGYPEAVAAIGTALDHLPWLKRCLGAEAPGDGVELARQIEALDFAAALETLHGLEEGIFTRLGEQQEPTPSTPQT